VQVKDPSGNLLMTYRYDCLGRRISEAKNGGATTDLYSDPAGQVLEEDVSGTPTAQNVWSAADPSAIVERDSGTGLTTRTYALTDASDNVTAIISAAGSVLQRYVEDVFGMPEAVDPTTSAPVSGWKPSTDANNWRVFARGRRLDP